MKINRLVNIWATVIHLSDAYFCNASKENSPDLGLLISEQLQIKTHNKQIWMIDAFYQDPGSTGILLRNSYQTIRDSKESYLILLTPGFADIVYKVPIRFIKRQLVQAYKRGKVFNKRVITAFLGIPSKCPQDISKEIKRLNKTIEHVARQYRGTIADLQNISYELWSKRGSRPKRLDEAAKYIAEAILNCHPSVELWKKIHDK